MIVDNLASGVTEGELKDIFAQAGACESVMVSFKESYLGPPRGFGFVEMGSDEDAQKAIRILNGQALRGRALRVNSAR